MEFWLGSLCYFATGYLILLFPPACQGRPERAP
jgi:hypothetical protein